MTENTKNPRTCAYCGVNIDHKRPQAKFCSPACKTKYNNERSRKHEPEPITKAAPAPAATKPARKVKAKAKTTPKPDILEDLVPLSEAKKMLHVQKQTLYKWNKSGLITIYAISERKQYVRRSELIKLIKPV